MSAASNIILWLYRLVVPEGDKVYIGAGRESGIYMGQRLRIDSGGKGDVVFGWNDKVHRV